MPHFIPNSLALLCVLLHSSIDATREISIVEYPNNTFEYSSPNYPNYYDNRLNLIKTVNLQDPTKYGYFFEIIDFEIQNKIKPANVNSGTCFDYFRIEPLSTIDNTDVSGLVTSAENFYNTKICGSGLPAFKVGDIVRLPNLSSFNIKFKTNSFYSVCNFFHPSSGTDFKIAVELF